MDKYVFSANLKTAIQNAGHTQSWMADQMGITAQSFSKYATGSAMPSVKRLYEISKLLNIDMMDLLKGVFSE